MIGLDYDEVTIERPGSASDAEGNPTDALSSVATTRGSYGTPSAQDLEDAGKRQQVIDAVVATSFNGIRLGDRLTVRGNPYEVVAIKDVRLHNRVFIRRAE
jgi:hypothetical protein